MEQPLTTTQKTRSFPDDTDPHPNLRFRGPHPDSENLEQVDAWYYRFLRRIIGIKASYYSRVSNAEVYHKAGSPRKPSDMLNKLQYKTLQEVFLQSPSEPTHSVVFWSAHKDRMQHQGRRKGMQFPYWMEVTTKSFFTEVWKTDHNARNPNQQYTTIYKILAESAPKRAQQVRAGHKQTMP